MDLILNNIYSLEAETAVIGAVLIEPEIVDEIVSRLEVRDFYTPTHQHIWSAIIKLYRRNTPVDIVTVTEQLNQQRTIEEVGGVDYLSKLAESIPTTANASFYCNIIKKKALRRRGQEVGEKIRIISQQQEYEEDEAFLAEVESLALNIRPKENGKIKHIKESRYDYLSYLIDKENFIHTGFPRFDKWIGGIGRGWLYILAGRPSVGKTAKALQMARGISENNVGNVLIFSQEMNRNQLLNRMLSPMTGINANKIRRKDLTIEELGVMEAAYKQLEKLPLFIEDASNISINHVRSVARQIKRQHGELACIVLDYLTIMHIPQSPGQTRSQAVGEVTRTAKQIAIELNVPFIMLAQLSREGAKSIEPRLDHLRDSGEIEQDADVVEFLWEDTNNLIPDGKVIQSIIAKGRDVGVNKFLYKFQGWLQKFEELE